MRGSDRSRDDARTDHDGVPGTAMIDFAVDLVRRGETSYVVALAGEVDMYTATPAFERELLAAIEAGAQEIVIDLSEATFVDSTFLAVLLSGHRLLESRGGRLTVSCDDPNLRKVFEITGLDNVFQLSNG